MSVAPHWEYGCVAFLDILGFAALVQGDVQAPHPQHLTRLIDSLAEARQSTAAGRLDVRAFSDSIVLSCSLELTLVDDLVDAVRGLQAIFARRAVLVRGGVAFGKHYADAEAIYSEALVRAYVLERDHARFPRILIDGDLADWYLNDSRTTDSMRDIFRRRLLRDRDGRLFVNYLDLQLLQEHRDLISSYSHESVTASVLEKLQWLAEYHNYIASELDVGLAVSGPLIQSFDTA
jgi:hypothetical protein